MITNNDGRIHVKMWLNEIEDGALEQVKNISNLPFAFHHVAIMPDCHQGYGMPIGSILATERVVIPNAVGVDIGCGLCAVRTSLTDIDKETLKKIMGGSKEFKGGIRGIVPVGFNHQNKKENESLLPDLSLGGEIVSQEFNNAREQIGTLGGGNHFIEIQKGDDGRVWVMIHSGSRNIGFKVAKHYNEIAVSLNEKYWSVVPKSWELAFLPVESQEGQDYIKEMNYCVGFALANRKLMMERVLSVIGEFTGATSEPMINIAHNYASLENQFGRNVWVHRKGATKADEGLTGIIPGSQGTNSYIVTGKGNDDSFRSCSHGAGRKMGRKEAERSLNLQDEIAKLDALGVIHGIRNASDLDEAAGAYKPIDEVMENQKYLVDIKVKLTPLAVIKG